MKTDYDTRQCYHCDQWLSRMEFHETPEDCLSGAIARAKAVEKAYAELLREVIEAELKPDADGAYDWKIYTERGQSLLTRAINLGIMRHVGGAVYRFVEHEVAE